MIRKKSTLILVMLMCLVLVAGCADPNVLKGTKDSTGDVAGFWFGLWNGLTAIFALICSIFTNVNIYEVHNCGLRYNLGFFIGMCIDVFIFLAVTTD